MQKEGGLQTPLQTAQLSRAAHLERRSLRGWPRTGRGQCPLLGSEGQAGREDSGHCWEHAGRPPGVAEFGVTEAKPPKPEGAQGRVLIRGSHSWRSAAYNPHATASSSEETTSGGGGAGEAGAQLQPAPGGPHSMSST